MSKYINILALALLGFLAGCATGTGYQPQYDQPSPMIYTAKDSGYTTTLKRVPGSVRYDEYTTLGTAVKQAGEVMITVTFNFQQRRNGEPRTGNCLLHIKSGDTSLASVKRCSITPTAGTFIVEFKTKEHGSQSFDLRSLGGKFVGYEPPYRSGVFHISIGDPYKNRNFRYDYVGKDPFNH